MKLQTSGSVKARRSELYLMWYEQTLRNWGKALETHCRILSALLNINMQSIWKPGAVQFHLVSIFYGSVKFPFKNCKGHGVASSTRSLFAHCLHFQACPSTSIIVRFSLFLLKSFFLSTDSHSAESDDFNHRNERTYRFEKPHLTF